MPTLDSSNAQGWLAVSGRNHPQAERDSESGWLAASWEAPNSAGDIARQGDDLSDLQHQVNEAVAAYLEEGAGPARIRLHFGIDPILVRA